MRTHLQNTIAASLTLTAGFLAQPVAGEPIDLDDPTGGVKGLRKL